MFHANARKTLATSLLFAVCSLLSAGCSSTAPPDGTTGPSKPPPPQAGNLVGSWVTDVPIGGSSQHWVYRFNRDNSMLETITKPDGTSDKVTETYTSTDNQVTITDGKAYTEQGTLTWIGSDQFHYRITTNTDDASQVGLETVFTRQSGAEVNSPIDRTLTADVIAQEFKGNRERANAKYGGKIWTFVGKLSNGDFIQPHIERGLTLCVDAPNVAHEYSSFDAQTHSTPYSLLCTFSEENNHQVTSLNKGDQVTIQGVCGGSTVDGYINFQDCSLVGKP